MPNSAFDLTTASNGFSALGANSLIDILFSEGALTQAQYDEIKVKAAMSGESSEKVLKNLNIVPEEKIAEANAKMLGIPYVSLVTTAFSPQALNLISRSVAERFLLIPFLYDENTKTLSIAMSNPVDLEAVSFVQQKTGLTIKTFAASETEIKNAIEEQYRQELVGEVTAAIKETQQDHVAPT